MLAAPFIARTCRHGAMFQRFSARAHSRAREVNTPYQPPLPQSWFRERQSSDHTGIANNLEVVLQPSRPSTVVKNPSTTVSMPQNQSYEDNITVPLKPETQHLLSRPTEALSPKLFRLLPPTLRKYTLHGKVAIVTGGARGLGLNMVQGLAESGVKAIGIFDIQPGLGNATATAIRQATGIPVKYYNVNVLEEKALTEAVDNVVECFGSVDALINSAGIAISNIKAEDYDIEEFCRTMDINANGSFRVAKACAHHMLSQSTGGSIIFIASMSGTIVNWPQEQCAYNASKAAVIQLAKSLAAEWAKHGIRVNSISPGYMDTALNKVPALDAQKKIWKSMTPQQRLGKVDELNNLAVFMASDASTFMTGSNVIIDGGYSIY